ncbi:hypothetical protein DV735_g762, partial [Chaetothyriales sp. CBS 134920]
MYLPRSLISHLYNHLLKTHHPTSPPVVILSSLDTDAICACRILTALLKRDYIPHTIQPVSGYADLSKVGEEVIRPMKTSEGGSGGVVVCLGVGGLVDLAAVLGLEEDENEGTDGLGGIDVWILDARRPWNLSNVFGGMPETMPQPHQPPGAPQRVPGVDKGCIQMSYKPGRGGIVVFDDGDIADELAAERDAFYALADMPELVDLRRSHERVLQQYYSLGTSYSEPISSLAYSLASDLGREDNDLLWLAIIGVTSLELNGQTYTGLGTVQPAVSEGPHVYHSSWKATRSARTYALLRDEVRRLNPVSTTVSPSGSPLYSAATPRESAIRLSPDPRFVLLRHWSLYDSMLYSPYVAARLHVWNESGHKRLHKLLAKMGVSLTQCKQTYAHMDIGLKKSIREQLLKYAGVYGLDGVIPVGNGRASYEQEGWSFVRTWGWKAQLNAADVGVVLGAILDMGTPLPIPVNANHSGSTQQTEVEELPDRSEALIPRFFAAYDALAPNQPLRLLEAIPKAQDLVRAIHRTGSSLLVKHQIRHLRAFRMGVVKDGPDLPLFANSPGALVKLALWVGEAVGVHERDKKGVDEATPLVLAALDEHRGTYVVVAFQEVVEETNARVKIDSFDHSVVEVKKEDLGGFLEGLSLKSVVVLAPTDDALSTFAQQNPGQMSDSLQVSHLLEYHIVLDIYRSDAFALTPFFAATLLTDPAYANVTGGQVVELTVVNGSAAIVSGLKAVSFITTPSDIPFVGGVIHSISSVLTIPVSIAQTCVAAGLEDLITLLREVGVLTATSPAVMALRSMADLTVFAPHGPELGAASYLDWNQLSTADVADMLEYSLVPHSPVAYSTSSSLSSNHTELPTLLSQSGDRMSVAITQRGSDIYVDNAHIIARDYLYSNGVLHVISEPLEPKSGSQSNVALVKTSSTTSSRRCIDTATAVGIGIALAVLAFGGVIAAAVVRRRRKRRSKMMNGPSVI